MIGYVTEAELVSYAAARGVTLSLAPNFLLTRALDWLELQPFSGSKTDPSQALQFPRNGETVIPEQIKTAQLAAALIYNDGNDLLAPIDQRVLREKAGPVEVQYSDKGNQVALYPQLNALLAGFLAVGGGINFNVSRG
jgi:hypothetical protein